MRSRRIHVLGASGSGTSSLAAAIARRHGHRHLDTDDFFWMPTDPPYSGPHVSENSPAASLSSAAVRRSRSSLWSRASLAYS